MKNILTIFTIFLASFSLIAAIMVECYSFKQEGKRYNFDTNQVETFDVCALKCGDGDVYVMSCDSDLMIAEFE